MVADCHSISARWRNNLFQLLNVNGVNYVRNKNSRTNSASECEIAIEKVKRHKSPGTDHVQAELIKEAGGRTIHSEIQKLHSFMWKVSRTVPIYKKGDNTDCSNYIRISLLPRTYNILSNILLSRLTPYAKDITGDHQCGF